jgi:hypothetical protein
MRLHIRRGRQRLSNGFAVLSPRTFCELLVCPYDIYQRTNKIFVRVYNVLCGDLP